MKPHLTLLTTSRYARNHGNLVPVADHIRATADGISEPVDARLHLRLASTPVWRHTLILIGTLDCNSAPEIEDEIDCLSQEGVTILTLDLRQLDAIDSTAVTVIASSGLAYKTRGQDFVVIPGSDVIRRALAEGGAMEFLTPEPNGSVARGLSSRVSDRRSSEMATTMIKEL